LRRLSGKGRFRNGSAVITFSNTLIFVAGLLSLDKRVSYRRLRKEFGLDDETLERAGRYGTDTSDVGPLSSRTSG
jgi:hypothetical protein